MNGPAVCQQLSTAVEAGFSLSFRYYGKDAVLGATEPSKATPAEATSAHVVYVSTTARPSEIAL